jgi:D-lactate dehydrogenase
MRIAYFFQEAWEEEYVRKALPDDTLAFYAGGLKGNPVSDNEAEALCVFIDSHIGEDELARFPKVKLIATRSTGYDHIDLAAAKKHGVTVVNVPFYGENTVAEFTFALILALSRKVAGAHRRVIETDTFSQDGSRGFDLEGRTLGIVGGGHIGMHVARIARGFQMNVVVFDVKPDEQKAKEFGFAYASLDELLGRSDIVTLHVPYNQHTHHLLNAESFKKMKQGAYLINTARGAVVETSALVASLASGQLAGAGLDVLEEEGDLSDELKLLAGPQTNPEELATILRNHYLISHPSVIVTPHIAFNTDEAIRRILDTTIENIKAFQAGMSKNLIS